MASCRIRRFSINISLFLKNCVTCPVSILSNRVKGPKTKGSVTVTDDARKNFLWRTDGSTVSVCGNGTAKIYWDAVLNE